VFNLSAEKVQFAIVFLIALILSIAVHEFGHAFVADRLGDRLPRMQGRVTLNPIAHIDLIGTIVMPLVIVFTGAPLLGWGKPVQTNPTSYTRRLRMKTGHMIVAAAGPTMNLVLALVVSIVFVVYVRLAHGADRRILSNIALLIQLNIGLMFFNLLPLPPLDGGTVLRGFIPDAHQDKLDFLDTYGSYILLALLVTGGLGFFMRPVNFVISGWFDVLTRIAA
jgi:Zn-dependent protease